MKHTSNTFYSLELKSSGESEDEESNPYWFFVSPGTNFSQLIILQPLSLLALPVIFTCESTYPVC
jgi:hypothetical protein